MKKIVLKKLEIENFKGITQKVIDFSEKTMISGQNAVGKTTVFDSVVWLLFNKDSLGSSNFAIRPMDISGKLIDNVEIKVSGTFEVDGQELVLTKVQKQNWVKHRGELEKRFEGNVNSFEVDGFPKKESDYKKAVAEIIDEDIFKLLTNPQTFPNMPWKEQRTILMKFVPEFSDVEIAEKNETYKPLLSDLQKADSVDDIRSKYSKAKSEYNKKLAEIPARIDEIAKLICDDDVAELELQKNEILQKIKENELKIASGVTSSLDDLRGQAMNVQMEMNAIVQKETDALVLQKRTLETEVFRKNAELSELNSKLNFSEKIVTDNTKMIKEYADRRHALGEEYNKIIGEKFDDSAWVFDESTTVCSLCGQKLPQDKIDELKSNFEQKKFAAKEKFESENKRLANSKIAQGKQFQKDEELMQKAIEDANKTLSDIRPQIEKINTEIAEINKKADAISTTPDLKANATYMGYKADYDRITKQIEEQEKACASVASENSVFEMEIKGLKEELSKVEANLQKVANNVQIEERIDSLGKEQQEIAQKVADQENMLNLLDEFIKEKMNVISKEINKHFRIVNFNLFKTYLNGGVEPCCEVTVNGISYNNVNSGHRIVAGLDIINSLCELYEVSVPVFTDNAESINDYNIPDMACQMILLKVSNDKEMKVEVQ